MKNKALLTVLSLLISLSMSAQLLVNEEPVILQTQTGDIYGTLKVPDSKGPVPLSIIIAGSGPTDRNGNSVLSQNNTYRMLADELFYNGIASLCYDKRGIAESSQSLKNEADIRFDHYIDDVEQWIDLLSEDKRFSDITIIGHSEGSLIGMIACENNPKVSKYISIAGMGVSFDVILKEQLKNQPQDLKETIYTNLDKLKRGETIPVVPPDLYSLFRPGVQPYMISIMKYDPQNEIAKLTIPAIIINGTTDIQVPVEHADMLANANPKIKKVIIENMNHLLKDCASTDIQEQNPTYHNGSIPLNKEIGKVITEFIKN